MTTYKITRLHRDDSTLNYTVDSGLSLEEAQEHCKDPETSSSTCTERECLNYTELNGPWFDAYTEE